MTTPQELIESARDLAALLARENAALEAVDFAAATGIAAAKPSATERFCRARAAVSAVSGEDLAALRPLGERLVQLGDENRRLLERAIYVQGRVISTLVRAIPRDDNKTRYGANGVVAAGAPPVALFARA